MVLITTGALETLPKASAICCYFLDAILLFFFSKEKVLRLCLGYHSTAWVQHLRVTGACSESILLAAIVCNKVSNVICWKLMFAVHSRKNLFYVFTAFSISADCKSNMHTCSANLCENQVLLVTQFAAKYCTCRQSFWFLCLGISR